MIGSRQAAVLRHLRGNRPLRDYVISREVFGTTLTVRDERMYWRLVELGYTTAMQHDIAITEAGLAALTEWEARNDVG